MLVLTRHVGEDIVIDRDVRVSVLQARGSIVRIGIDAPQSVSVLRQEILDRPKLRESAAAPTTEAVPCSCQSGIMERLIRIAR